MTEQKEISGVINEPHKFKVGDKVKVIRTLPVSDNWDSCGWEDAWVDDMDDFLGGEFIVEDITGSYGYHLQGYDLGAYNFPSCVLELVEEHK